MKGVTHAGRGEALPRPGATRRVAPTHGPASPRAAGQRLARMTGGHDPDAAVSNLRAQGVRAVRLLYTDLHGVARGKDIALGHFADLYEEGTTFCSAVMGTDLRH